MPRAVVRLAHDWRSHLVLAFVRILVLNVQFALLNATTGGNSSSSSSNIGTNFQVDQQQQQRHQQVPNRTTFSSSFGKSNERFNLIEADENGLYLLGLFDIHQSNPRVPFKCGQIDLDAGEWQSHRPMQNMEAFLWAIEQVNADKSILPGIRLGSLVMDTCSSFLRTNQQLANLLHQSPREQSAGQQSSQQQQLPGARQILAIVADNSDPHSIEAVVGMASALGLTTFVTQSRSTKLSELASKYNSASQKLARDSGADSASSIAEIQQLIGGPSTRAHPLDSILDDLLGIGKMSATPLSLLSMPEDEISNAESPQRRVGDLAEQQQQQQQLQQEKLLMVRMLLGNELLAEALATLVQQMGWDFVSLIYDDEPDMVDLHDELTRQLFARNIQLALDEQLSLTSSPASVEVHDRLLHNLAKKSQHGARIVITLLGTGSARLLLDSLNHLRQSARSPAELVNQVNSLLWITVSDREPYYSFAVDALGTISISSSVSLLPKFKSHYDHLINDEERQLEPSKVTGGNASNNKWWPEYMRSILLKHHKEIELLSNECAKWQEPKVSPLNEKCRALTLSSLVQVERLTQASSLPIGLAVQQRGSSGSSSQATTTTGKSKLAKYLAGGWEHNGMDVIDSVAAIANGLEYIRQALCPESASGMCDRMRELIVAHSSPPTSTSTSTLTVSQASDAALNTKPMLSELIYEELLRSTFQLADGRLFNMDEFSSLGGQVEGKFKLYNLRYLQPNSIGFVRFGQFEQQDGLVLNASKARHYPAGASFKKQVSIEQVKSSCEDERKCLMMSALELASMNKQTISEEEAALGVNSLFKLDHPLMVLSSASSASVQAPTTLGNFGSDHLTQANSNSKQPAQLVGEQHAALPAGVGGVQTSAQLTSQLAASKSAQKEEQSGVSVRRQQQEAIVRQVSEDSHIRTMRPSRQTSSAFYNWPAVAALAKPQQQQQQRPQRNLSALARANSANMNYNNSNKLTFNAIVLLPLHKRAKQQQVAGEYQSSSSASKATDAAALSACSHKLDIERSFQHLVALAYGLNTAAALAEEEDADLTQQQQQQQLKLKQTHSQRQQVELTTTVIDYCEHDELAESKLALKLTSSEILQYPELPVAIIDFDTRLSERIDEIVGHNANLLHLTIGAPMGQLTAVDPVEGLPSATAASKATSHSQGRYRKYDGDTSDDERQHLRVSLLPSKANEIQALVSLLVSMGRDWRLVHLIYTDHHHYRDEFVRRANEANVCVSKLIWIPSLEEENVEGNVGAESTGSLIRQKHLAKTKKLFERELYDYSSGGNISSAKFATQEQQQQHIVNMNMNEAEGLNSTRVLVVLASANDATNGLILSAATKSMLQDYVWLTTHEWLSSVELAAEQQWPSFESNSPSSNNNNIAKADGEHQTSSPSPSSSSSSSFAPEAFATSGEQLELAAAGKLPRLFASTRIETYSSDHYRRYFASLSPAIHSPVPTGWFDEFWEQKFQCRLPISSLPSSSPFHHHHQQQHEQKQRELLPVCKSNQHLNLHGPQVEDDRVSYVIQAVESMYAALRSQNMSRRSDFSAKEFSAKFKQNFQEQQHSAIKGFLPNGIAKLPYGFHIVHRLLPTEQQQQLLSVSKNSRRRQNSRDLSPTQPGQLVKVGIWRDGELILLRKQNGSMFSWLNSARTNAFESHEDYDSDDTGAKVAKSLGKLVSVKSRCFSSQICNLCRQQIEQTNSQIKSEEARLKQSESISEPKAISSIDLSLGKQQRQLVGGGFSILDTLLHSTFDEDNGSDGRDGQSDNSEDNSSDGPNNNEDGVASIGENSIHVIEGKRRQQGQVAAPGKHGRQAVNNRTTGSQQDSSDEIQASASSLFDAATSQQVEQQRLADLARAHQHMMTMMVTSQAATSDRRHQPLSCSPIGLSSRRSFILSLLSVVGIVGTLLVMIYLYPSMETPASRMFQYSADDLEPINGSGNFGRRQARQHYSATCSLGSFHGRDNYLVDPSISEAVNMGDYFLLTGLLMLNSINIAFLLPATMSVCWFRRIGLAISYTVMLSSILVKVFANYWQRSSSRQTTTSSGSKDSHHQSSATCLTGQQQQQSYNQPHEHLDPLDENVEVTFESLPHCEQPNSIVSYTADSGQRQQRHHADSQSDDDVFMMSAADRQHHHLFNGYQSSSLSPTSSTSSAVAVAPNGIAADTAQCPIEFARGKEKTSAPYGDSSLSMSLLFILVQVLVSIVWLVQQPSEPTLYSGCWHCASPFRAPLLFLYEPLLSLLFPALILLLSWPISIAALRGASRSRSQFKRALKKLQLNGSDHCYAHTNGSQTVKQHQEQTMKLYQLSVKVRDAKSLVMTTTSLVLVWLVLTLATISAGQNKYYQLLYPAWQRGHSREAAFFSSGTTFDGDGDSSSEQTAATNSAADKTSGQADERTIVEANLLSGAIIFTFLFIYRLGLLRGHYFLRPTMSKTESEAASSQRFKQNSIGSQRQVLTLNRHSSSSPHASLQRNNNKWLGFSGGSDVATGDDFAAEFQRQQHGHSSSTGLFKSLKPFVSSSVGSARNQNQQSERLGLQQFSSYATYGSQPTTADSEAGNCGQFARVSPLQAIVSSFADSPSTSGASRQQNKASGCEQQDDSKLAVAEKQGDAATAGSAAKRRKSSSLFGSLSSAATKGSSHKKKPVPKPRSINAHLRNVVGGLSGQSGSSSGESKLQRRQSTGSVASSTAQLVGNGGHPNNSPDSDEPCALDDTISVASSSNSQLHGNDLYPIDCSLQLETEFDIAQNNYEAAANNSQPFNRSSSFKRMSLRRSSINSKKLSSVIEEQAPS